MSVARFSWVPNLYNIHFLVENQGPQPAPVNSHPVMFLPLVAKSRYLHFCVPVPSKNTGIDAVFTMFFAPRVSKHHLGDDFTGPHKCENKMCSKNTKNNKNNRSNKNNKNKKNKKNKKNNKNNNNNKNNKNNKNSENNENNKNNKKNKKNKKNNKKNKKNKKNKNNTNNKNNKKQE